MLQRGPSAATSDYAYRETCLLPRPLLIRDVADLAQRHAVAKRFKQANACSKHGAAA
jgi:hypothetical protein